MSESEELDDSNSISFKIDSGLIDRLGRELVGKAETAVSELIKNAYDADARNVDVDFIQTNKIGGSLIIHDDGVGMTMKQLRDGFMTISSTDKIHNPVSERYRRNKAGRKGIGRFATQRLGKKLTIITQTLESDQAIELTIEWDSYEIDTILTSIKNPVKYLPKTEPEGTTLIIENLREWWSEADIHRVYRFVSDLLQPDYISDRSREFNYARQNEESFKVSFVQINDGQPKTIADPERMLFGKALAVIEGYVDAQHDGYCTVTSNSLDVSSDIIPVPNNKVYEEDDGIIDEETGEKKPPPPDPKYRLLNDVHFKAYYYIYNREIYYTNINKGELASIQKLSNEQGGIRLYRNGFRVLPYGELHDDWLKIDRRYYNDSGTNAPFGNRNLFGFVEIIDPEGKNFQETASREGLIENESYKELTDFLHKALEAGRARLRYGVEKIKREQADLAPLKPQNELFDVPDKTTIQKLLDLEKSLNEIASQSQTQESATLQRRAQNLLKQLKSDFQLLLDELGMLRVLAGLGLTIGEFTHEVVQFSPSIMGDLSVIGNQSLNEVGLNSLENLKRTIQLFISYTSYFNATVSANVSRELKPQDLEKIVKNFKSIIDGDLTKLKFDFVFEPYGYDLITIPMHSSEWSSILFNLYTNSKKAIWRKGDPGRIKIVLGKENAKVYLEFSDNGDGIPDENRKRIFEPFFTTSAPTGFEATDDEKLTGTGLGLKIVKDIVQTYGGTIEVIKPETGYATCFRLELPLATENQRTDYGL